MIVKPRTSRSMRATLRITLESSTTRHILILSSTVRSAMIVAICSLLTPRDCSCGCVEHLVYVEDDQHALPQPMHTTREPLQSLIEVDRIILQPCSRQLEHFSEAVDQQPVGLPVALETDGHRAAFRLRRLEL